MYATRHYDVVQNGVWYALPALHIICANSFVVWTVLSSGMLELVTVLLQDPFQTHSLHGGKLLRRPNLGSYVLTRASDKRGVEASSL